MKNVPYIDYKLQLTINFKDTSTGSWTKPKNICPNHFIWEKNQQAKVMIIWVLYFVMPHIKYDSSKENKFIHKFGAPSFLYIHNYVQ